MDIKELEKQVIEQFHISENNREEIEALTDYWLNGGRYRALKESTKKIVNEYYNRRIEKNKENITTENVKVVITPVSFIRAVPYNDNSQSAIDELPIQKSLRVFPNIEKIILLHTSDTQANAKAIRKILKTEYSIDVVLEQPDETTISLLDIYKKHIVDCGEYETENVIIDITAGMKITAIQLYKLAVESDIKVINWVEPYKPRIKQIDDSFEFDSDNSFRVSLNTSLQRMMQPAEESKNKKAKLNSYLDSWNFQEAANYYQESGNDTLATIFTYLHKIINITSLLTLNYEEMEKNAKEFKDFLAYTFKDRSEVFVLNNYSYAENLFILLSLISESVSSFKKNYLIAENKKDPKAKYNFCDSAYNNSNINDKLKNQKFNNLKENILNCILSRFVANQIGEKESRLNLHLEYKLPPAFEDYIDETFYDLIDETTQDLENYTITLENGVLRIPKFNIQINLVEIEEFKNCFNEENQPKGVYCQALKELLIFTKNDLQEFIQDIDILDIDKNKTEGTLTKDRSNFKKSIIEPINAIVLKESAALNLGNQKLILFETKKNKKDKNIYTYKINEFYYSYE